MQVDGKYIFQICPFNRLIQYEQLASKMYGLGSSEYSLSSDNISPYVNKKKYDVNGEYYFMSTMVPHSLALYTYANWGR
jgi:hypothetical protein